MAIFDEQQGLDNQRRNGVEVRILPLRVAKLVKRFATTFVQGKTCLGLFCIGSKEAPFGEFKSGLEKRA